MKDLREKRRQLLNLTITEIILIMLFLVLLITASLIEKFIELEKKNKEQAELIKTYKSLQVDQAMLKEFRKFEEAIKKLKEGNGEFAKMEISEIINELILAKDNYEKIKDKDTEIAQLKEKLKDYEKDKKELAYYKKKYGSGIPPCWTRAQEANSFKTLPEYLYDAIITNDGIILNNTDARYPHRINDRKNLPLSQIRENIALSDTELMLQALQVFEANKDTCRHYISVKDESGNDKRHYVKMMRAIESRFFIYEDK